MNKWLDSFNPPQREAVEYVDGPSLVIAGAGSGKTRVLTYKVAWLLEHGYQPWSILALTFTNKAANEMKTRIAKVVGVEMAKRLWAGTFHSVFLRILRAEHEHIGFSSNFTIYDAADSKSLVKAIVKEMELDEKVYKSGKVLGAISHAKNQLVDARQYVANRAYVESDARANIPALGEIYRRYSNRCKQSDAMDFDDILLYTWQLFDQHPDVLERWEGRFAYVLVDEYQDTNFAQHRIVWQLTHRHQRVCVVGDDAQSIYGFRGAEIDNILNFCNVYDNVRMFKLERNYRSTQYIVDAANSLIGKNRRQIHKRVFSENERGEKLRVVATHSDLEEASVVEAAIRRAKQTGECDYSDMAVLYRTNAQSRALEDAFLKSAIPYRVYGSLSFYQRKEIKDVLAYFRMAVNPNDEEAFKRIVNYPTRGIGQTTVARIVEAAVSNDVSLWQVVCQPLAYGLPLNRGTLDKLEKFRILITSFAEQACVLPVDEVGMFIVKQSGIFADIFQDACPENLARQENVEALLNGIRDFCDMRREEGDSRVFLADYLPEVALLTDMDTDKDSNPNKVTLMTIHAAKGLEFDRVFVVGMEEGLFPNQMASGSVREMEEERRLLYVAITRAKRFCTLTYAQCRYKFGQMEFAAPSRFLQDIDACFLERGTGRKPMSVGAEVELPWQRRRTSLAWDAPRPSAPRTAPTPVARREFSTKVEAPVANGSAYVGGLAVGMHIEHNRFGRGEVVEMQGSGDGTKATVRFEHVGQKTLLLKYAKFTILSDK